MDNSLGCGVQEQIMASCFITGLKHNPSKAHSRTGLRPHNLSIERCAYLDFPY